MSPPESPTPPLDVVRLGKVIAHFRELRNITAATLAERAGIAKSYLYKLERGVAENPGLKTLDGVARALEVTLFDLLSEAGVDLSVRAADMRNTVAEVDRLLENAPKELRDFLAELEMKEGPVPLDVVRSLASLRLRGKHPRTLSDWRYAYESLNRAVR